MSLLEERLNAANLNQNQNIPPSNVNNGLMNRMNLQNTFQPDVDSPSDNQNVIYEPPKEKKSLFSKDVEMETEEFVRPDTNMSEEMLEAYEMKKHRDEERRVKKSQTTSKIVNGILGFACVYIIFLIYGVVVTNYAYNENGQIEPQVLSVSDIKANKEFDIILGQYENCRTLYEETLLLDYRLGEGVEDPMTLAPQYEALLDDVENLSVKTDALDVETQYDQLKETLLVWIQDDIAIYLQKMSSAITQNNEEDANIAVAYKSQVYNDFSQITSNIVALGESIHGTDVTEIKKWSPETYVNNTINSLDD